jgi:excisionase family DNA binding protein
MEVQTEFQKQPRHRALRPKHAARAYGVSRTLIYEWMKSGRLASVKLGGARLIPVDALEALLAAASK